MDVSHDSPVHADSRSIAPVCIFYMLSKLLNQSDRRFQQNVISTFMARNIYLRHGIGVGAFRNIYGGSQRNGALPPLFYKSSGYVAHHILQQLKRNCRKELLATKCIVKYVSPHEFIRVCPFLQNHGHMRGRIVEDIVIANVLTIQWLFIEHIQIIHSIEHGDVFPKIQTYKQIVNIVNCVAFEVLEGKDLVLPSSQP